ncbi:unnamed protein product [Lampetra fluviatilis]
MLQQILRDMFIEPELLSELNDDQKQILFFKMREEQVRRWKEREEQIEKEQKTQQKKPNSNKRDHGKTVHWQMRSDGEVWVCVMGEDPALNRFSRNDIQRMVARRPMSINKSADNQFIFHTNIFTKQTSKESAYDSITTETTHLDKNQKGSRISALSSPTRTDQRGEEPADPRRILGKMCAESDRRKQWMKVSHERQQKEDEKKEQEEDDDSENIYANFQQSNYDAEEMAWQEALKKAKAADEARRQLALRTREEYKRQSIRAIEKGSVASLTNRFVGIDVQDCPGGGGARPGPKPVPPPRPTKLLPGKKPELPCPASRQAIVTWFREREIPRRACFRGNADTVAPWFHGLISREDAEELLSGTAEGTFLLRVSERVWGYALSYRMARSTKHFLVDAAGDSYSFFGVDQIKHASLPELVNFHKVEPVTVIGGEILKTPCGQPQGKLPDYGNLFS